MARNKLNAVEWPTERGFMQRLSLSQTTPDSSLRSTARPVE